MFISLYTTRLILNSLGASDFGIFNIVGGAISMLGFLNAAMASATQRFMSYSEGEGNKKKQKSIFNISLILHFGIALIVGIALLVAGYFFFNGILNIPANRIGAAKVVYGSLIISTMFTVMNVPYDAVMNAHENMKYYALVGIIESLLKLVIAFSCVYSLYDKLIVYGVLMACVPLLTLTIMKVYCHHHYEECTISFRKYRNRTLMKEMTSFAGWSFLLSFSSVLSQQGGNLVLNHFYGTIVNAAQGITYQLSGQLGALSTQATKALNPIIVKDAGGKQLDAMYRISSIGSKLIFFFTSFIFIPVILNVEPILNLWLVNIPQYTTIFVILYFTVNMLDTLCMFFSTAISGIGRIRNYSIIISFIGCIPFLGCIALFDIGFQPYYIYVLMIVSSIIKLYFRIYYSWKYCGFNLSKVLRDDLFRPICCVCIIFCIFIPFKRCLSSTMDAIIYTLAILFLYSFIYYIWGLNNEEKRKMNEIRMQLIKKLKPI